MSEDVIIPDEAPLSTAQQYQDQRIASLPAVYRTAHEQLACELALQMEEPEDIFARYGYTPDQGIALMGTPQFSVLLERVSREVRESGLSFKTKAKMQAEALLTQSFQIATDPLQSAAVRADLIKWTAAVAGYSAKKDDDKASAGSGLNLTITFAGQAPMKVVQNEPIALEA